MPLELGLDLGAKAFGSTKWQSKRILILEQERYRFQQALSDISNSDIKAHAGEPDQIVCVVRDWLVQEAQVKPVSPTVVWYEFNDCLADIFDNLRKEGYTEKDIGRFPEHELIQRMTKWVKEFVAA
jgi:hypothetical protein